MAAECPQSIQACGLRVTLLDSQGNVAPEPNNSITQTDLVTIGFSPEIEAGTDLTVKTGCDQIGATYRGADLLKRFNLTMDKLNLSPAFVSMVLGAPVILDGSDPIGWDWPNQSACGGGEDPPFVAVEFWSVAWECGGPNPGFPYWHWVFPMARFQIGDAEFSNTAFFQPALTGFTLNNPLWGHGPYGDDPGQVIGELGSVWLTDTAPPAAVCGYSSVTPSS